ncbi:hypothetical protein H0H92_003174 [Tricholoma furcatifolium]|nr:hypothetical protein H0H92_003174 [Tricholoma furcatifolium]
MRTKFPRIEPESIMSTQSIGALDDFILEPAIVYMALKEHSEHDRKQVAHLGVKLYEAFINVFRDFKVFQKFLDYRGKRAQVLIDALQALIDSGVVEQNFWVGFISALTALAIHSQLYSKRLVLHGLTYQESDVKDDDSSRLAQGLLDGAAVCITFHKRSSLNEQAWFQQVMLHAQPSHHNVLPLYGLCRSDDENYFPGLVTPKLEDHSIFFQNHDATIRRSLISDIAAGMAYLHNDKLIYGKSGWYGMYSKNNALSGACVIPVSLSFDAAGAAASFPVGNKDDFVESYCDLGLWSHDWSPEENVKDFGKLICTTFSADIPGLNSFEFLSHCSSIIDFEYPPAGYLHDGLDQSLWQLLSDCTRDANVKPTASEVVSRLQVSKQLWDNAIVIQKQDTDSLVKLATAFQRSTLKQPVSSIDGGIVEHTRELYNSFLDVFRNLSKYRNFLDCRAEKAQVLIDAMQTLLDNSVVEQEFRTIFILALVALAMRSRLYPKRLVLEDITYQESGVEGVFPTQTAHGFLHETEVCITWEGRDEQHASEEHWFGAVVMAAQLPVNEHVSQFFGLCPPMQKNYFPGIVTPWLDEDLYTFLERNPDIDTRSRRSFIIDVAAAISYLHDNGISLYYSWGHMVVAGTPPRARWQCLAKADFRWWPQMAMHIEPKSLTLWSSEHEKNQFLRIDRGIGWVIDATGFQHRLAEDVKEFSEIACEVLWDNRPSLKWFEHAQNMISKGNAMPTGLLQEGVDAHLWQVLLDCQLENRSERPSASEIVQRLEWAGKQWDLAVRLLGETRQEIASLFAAIFGDKHFYRHLLSCNEDNAQDLLDTLQLLLDIRFFPELDRGQAIAALERLSKQRDLYPAHFLLDTPVFLSDMENMPIASGGYADIYQVSLWQDGRRLETCFKVIRIYEQTGVESLTKLYAKEAIVWAQLSHPNILPFLGICQFHSRPAIVTPWAENGHINDYLTRNPDVNRVLLCFDTAEGLEYLHRNDIVHGDLKGVRQIFASSVPVQALIICKCNILIDSSGRASIADFGLANVTDPSILKWTSQSTIASKGGTTRWHAPELLAIESEDTSGLGSVCNTKASDVFAWSNICYEIFTGQLPFYEVSHPVKVMVLIMRGATPTRPEDDDVAWQQYGLTNHIWYLMKRCWSFEPSQRPDMTAVISRLDAKKPTDTRPPGDWDEAHSVRLRNDEKAREAQDSQEFWDGVKRLLLEVVPGLEVKDIGKDI